MPQANKKRGRRMEEKKRKREDDAGTDEAVREWHKRRRSQYEKEHDEGIASESLVDGAGDDGYDNLGNEGSQPTERAFFGTLDDDEQEYFRRADDLLEANNFPDPNERSLFLANVYREADGKELRLAQSQSCSRLMERLIQLSTPSQLKKIFSQFRGKYAAPVVAEELASPNTKNDDSVANSDDDKDAEPPAERLFLDVLAELEGSVGYLLTDRYASHVLRVLLLVLSGEPIDTAAMKRLVQSKRKESNSVHGTDDPNSSSLAKSRRVPQSFSESLEQLIAESIAGLDTEQLRSLATHPNGNPTLQLLLRLELTQFGKQRAKDEASVIRVLLPDDPITADSESATFINGLVYDPIGSHLLECIIENAPGKMFKTLYQEFFKERMASHARNEVASYVVCRILGRLGHDDLLEAHELLVPHVTSLLQRNRTIVVRTLIERCTIRDIDTQAIAVQVDNTWHGEDGFEIKKLIKYDPVDAVLDNKAHDSTQSSANETPAAAVGARNDTESVKTHFNLLTQSMLLVPGSLSALVLDSLIGLDSGTLFNMAKDPIVTRTLQAALTSKNASMITTRKLVQHFYGRIGEMALDVSASHVVDCIWEGTHGLAFIRERIAEELAENESQLRDSLCGRAVWKNWKMDLYKRRRGDWIRQSKAKASNDGFQSFSELDVNKEGASSASYKKTPLQLARERHAKNKAKNETEASRPSKSSNSSRSSTTSRGGAAAFTATAVSAVDQP